MSYLTTAIVALALVLAPASAQAAEDNEPQVVIDGSGWGHGVGMSQYGAYGMSTLGSTHAEILTHYYQGSTVEVVEPPPPLWVNLERDFDALQLAVAATGSLPGEPVIITSSDAELSAQPGATIDIALLEADGCSLTVTEPEPDPEQPAQSLESTPCSVDLEWYSWDTPDTFPPTKVTIVGCTLPDWNVAPTEDVPCQYARGMLHLRSGADGLDLSAEMLLEDYALGISEMPFYWSETGGEAALRAQAVAARSYARELQLTRGDPADNSCDAWCHVRDTTFDQRYVGWGHSNTGAWVAAVQDTAGELVTHVDAPNEVVRAYYHSSSGGRTENGDERFGLDPSEFLSSVDDSPAVDGTVYNPKASWQEIIPATEVAAAVGLDRLTGVSVAETRSGSGSTALVEYSGVVDGVATTVSHSGTWTRTEFDLYSEYFTIQLVDLSDELLFYRDAGIFAYYEVDVAGVLALIESGSTYSPDWSIITNIDLDGDNDDEVLFYRTDGVFAYYDIDATGKLTLIKSGSTYSPDWSIITNVDLDGDNDDEMLFYRTDGVFRYYEIDATGKLTLIRSGSSYAPNWSIITNINLDG